MNNIYSIAVSPNGKASNCGKYPAIAAISVLDMLHPFTLTLPEESSILLASAAKRVVFPAPLVGYVNRLHLNILGSRVIFSGAGVPINK